MAGVSLIDMATAILPRTYVDAKTNGFAAAETFRRESSGLVVNCLIPGFIVLGAAKLLEAFDKNSKGLSGMWANQDALETFQQHFHDIKKLLKAFDALIEHGHTVIVIEHNLDVAKCADYIIDLGPDGGDKGGQLVFSGRPEDIVKCKESYTGKYLKGKLL